MGFLAGKKALVVGLATDRSIAWGIAQALRREGAELAFTYQNDRIKDRVVDLAGQLGSTLVMPMDVGTDAEIDAAFGANNDPRFGADTDLQYKRLFSRIVNLAAPAASAAR